MTTATHEKQISKVPPWVLLGVGGLLVFGGLFTISLAAVWDELTPGIALFFGGLAFIGVLLVVVSIPERRRAEDWDNWKVPAQQIAEIHAFLLSRLGAEGPNGNGHHEAEARDESDPPGDGTAGVITMPNTRVYELGIEEGLRRARGRRDGHSPN